MSEFLHIYVQNALGFNADLLPKVHAGKASLREVLSFCTNYRIAGIGFLFLSGTAKEFRRRLQQSGAAYSAFLMRAGDAEKRGSQAMPFFDALAAGDLESAELIAVSSVREWKKGTEYEEDFLFPEYLMQRFFLGASSESGGALLDRWEKALQGADDRRLEICRALEAKDSRAFDGALRTWLQEREARFARERDAEILPAELGDTEAYLSVEALGLLRLAQRAGLETSMEYPAAPSIARDDSPMSFSLDSWKTVD